MLKNYFKIAFRNLYRQKIYASINISGLALGLAVALVIGMFARHKLSYDRYHPNVERLYRVIQTGFACAPPGLAKALEVRYPEFEVITEVSNPTRYLIGKTPDEAFYIPDIITADEHFFAVFPYPVLSGNPQTMLSRPGQMVLTQSLAKQLFGAENPLGRRLTIEAKSQYVITGVIEDIPRNSHLHFQAIFSLSREGRQARFAPQGGVNWSFYSDYLYARLHPNTDLTALEAKMTAWANDVHPYEPKNFGLFLQPITEIHLRSKLGNEIAPQSDIRYLYFFAALAVVVLAVACFNYMNLATARAMQRSREIGVRKVCGATRAELIRQFLAESLLFTLIALPLAMGLAEAAIPAINRWAGEVVAPGLALDALTLTALAGIILLTGLAAGSYPALFLSSFRPTTVLGKIPPCGMKGGFLRKIFVICQFAATVMLIFATLTIWSQLDYIRNKRLGFEKDYVVTFSSHFLGEKYQAFKQTLLQSPHILAVSSGPATGIGHKNMTTTVTPADSSKGFRLTFLRVDYEYIETLGLVLQTGRTFSPDYATDTDGAVILNEAAARRLAIADDPVGRTFGKADRRWRVVGVIDDFHNNSLKSPVQPVAFSLRPGHNWTGLVRLEPQNVQAGLAAIQKGWEQFVPERPFEYAFLSDRIARQYRTEQRLAGIFTLFAGLAIFIACLGLFGLAAYAAERRTKEIGIRKVLGASVANVTALLSKDFVKLVLLANLIAWPVAWWAMSQWLQNFAYRIEIGWWVFALAGGLALVIALLTVCTQAMRAALANPVKSLRYE